MSTHDIVIVGAGIYGVTAARELRRRGAGRIALLDPGPIPHPLAASTDISKVVRMEYGADAEYMAIVDEAIDGWHAWNDELGETLYHETGVTMLCRQPMEAGGFEFESFQNLILRGRTPERVGAREIAERFPSWSDLHVDGFFHARGGFAESGRVVEALARRAQDEGISIHAGRTVDGWEQDGTRIRSVRTREGESFAAGEVVVCAGAWTPGLVPELEDVMVASGHPVFHVRPPDPAAFTAPGFVVFTADVARTGWYGFPVHPREGVVKIANHGVGVRLDPEHDERIVTEDDHEALRRFLRETFPALADAPVVYTRRCLYCDTRDEHLWIDRHPRIENLTVAAGGSGHAFKMGPVLGGMIADAVLGEPNPWLPKFAWRDLPEDVGGQEAARYHG